MRTHRSHTNVRFAQALGAVVMLACGPASAQPPDWNVPIRASALSTDWRASLPRTNCDNGNCSTDSGSARLSWNLVPTTLGAQIVEFKPPEVPGNRQRPRHGLAFESSGMRSFLAGMGLDAERCQAPILRMHTKLSTGFKATAWMYARCTLR
jgi:hypothetical protein